jgi:hypothetical protein
MFITNWTDLCLDGWSNTFLWSGVSDILLMCWCSGLVCCYICSCLRNIWESQCRRTCLCFNFFASFQTVLVQANLICFLLALSLASGSISAFLWSGLCCLLLFKMGWLVPGTQKLLFLLLQITASGLQTPLVLSCYLRNLLWFSCLVLLLLLLSPVLFAKVLLCLLLFKSVVTAAIALVTDCLVAPKGWLFCEHLCVVVLPYT